MPYKYNPFTGTLDDTTLVTVAAAASGTAASPGISFSGDTNTGIYNPGADQLAIATGGTGRLFVDASGNFGVGTLVPQYKIDVRGGNYGFDVFGANNGVNYLTLRAGFAPLAGGGIGFQCRDLGSGNFDGLALSASQGFSLHTNGGAECVRITQAGNFGIGTTGPTYQLQLSTDSASKPSSALWTITSDERIKEDIELADLDLCYDAVKTIPLKRYKWRDEVYSDEKVSDRNKLGWIAQDVETVFPKAVNVHEFKYGEGDNEVVIPDCRDLNADQIYAAMYGALQKLMAKVEALEVEVVQLKG
jgi:hypothetical protein